MLKIGGVCEYFNYPFLGGFLPDVDFKVCAAGSGQMLDLLNKGEIDIALMLTEAAMKAQKTQTDLCILSEYVSSPLHWGVYISPAEKDNWQNLPKIFAVSRLGSGSHLMANLWAKDAQDALQFLPVETLDNAIVQMARGEAHFFLWEQTTTLPYVAQGKLHQIDSVQAPWAAFVLVTKQKTFVQKQAEIQALYVQLGSVLQTIQSQEDSIEKMADFFKLPITSLQEAYALLQWVNVFPKPISLEIQARIAQQLLKNL